MSDSSRKLRHPGINMGNTDPVTDKHAESLLFGFWIFLMSDLVLFALLFANYAAQSHHGVAAGPAPENVLELTLPFIETMLLLASSFTFGLAALALKYREDTDRLIQWLVVTFVLGAGFIVLEISEFSGLIADGHGPQTSGFLSAFFLMVGTHGIHVFSGLIWLLVMLAQIRVFGLDHHVKTRIMRLAIFWHMLDVVWIGIFTFVYLFGVA